MILKFVFGLQVKGREHIPKKGGFILASNHTSYIDPVAVGVASPRRLSYMARHDLFSHYFFAWLLRAIEVFPVKRDSADLSALKEAMHRVQDKQQGLLLFPEGTRSTTGEISSVVEPGIGFLVAKLNVPVIPVFVKGAMEALPRGAKSYRRNRISVSFGEQIFIERRMPYQDIAKKIMEEIRHLSCKK